MMTLEWAAESLSISHCILKTSKIQTVSALLFLLQTYRYFPRPHIPFVLFLQSSSRIAVRVYAHTEQ